MEKHHHSKAAMKHPDKLGEGAKKRAHIKNPKTKVATVMEEFKHGTLHSGSGAKVSNPKQAIAIGLSEARKSGAHIKSKGEHMAHHKKEHEHHKKAHEKKEHHKEEKHHPVKTAHKKEEHHKKEHHHKAAHHKK